MNKKIFNVIGWILLLGMVALWIGFGYSDWNLVLLPAAYLCFSISNGSLKKLKLLTLSQIMLVVFAFIISVAIAFGLIQLANYMINDVLHLQGWMNILFVYLAIILSLFPVVLGFGNVINKIDDSLKTKNNDSLTKVFEYDDLKIEANEMLKSMTKIQTIKTIRQRHGLSLVEAKNIVDLTKQ